MKDKQQQDSFEAWYKKTIMQTVARSKRQLAYLAWNEARNTPVYIVSYDFDYEGSDIHAVFLSRKDLDNWWSEQRYQCPETYVRIMTPGGGPMQLEKLEPRPEEQTP